MHISVIITQRAKLNQIKNLFNVQPEPAKNPAKTPVKAIVAAYIPAVEPMRIHCQRLLLLFSQFSRHVSVQE